MSTQPRKPRIWKRRFSDGLVFQWVCAFDKTDEMKGYGTDPGAAYRGLNIKRSFERVRQAKSEGTLWGTPPPDLWEHSLLHHEIVKFHDGDRK